MPDGIPFCYRLNFWGKTADDKKHAKQPSQLRDLCCSIATAKNLNKITTKMSHKTGYNSSNHDNAALCGKLQLLQPGIIFFKLFTHSSPLAGSYKIGFFFFFFFLGGGDGLFIEILTKIKSHISYS